MRHKIYVETTIVSYLCARPSMNPIVAGRQELTKEWWNNHRMLYDLFISELVSQEASDGDHAAASQRLNHLSAIDSLKISDEAILLANHLVNNGPIPKEYGEDALHIAICAVNGLTFSLRGIVSILQTQPIVARLKTMVEMQGYLCPIICTPEELMEE